MNQRVAIVPDLNQNEAIEGFANTAGAYTGAAVTAVVGGLGTLLNGLFRGAVAGAQQTYANAGHTVVAVTNTSQSRSPAPSGLPSFNLQIAPTQPQPVQITDAELQLIQDLRSGRLTLSNP